MRLRPVPLLLAAALLVGSCSGTADEPAAAPAPTTSAAQPPSAEPLPTPVALTWTSCAPGFECAVLPVPLDRDDPGAGDVGLAVTRRPGADPAQRVGSLVVNPGGPGASAVAYLHRAWEQVPTAVRARFDLVAFDPRGVGGSEQVRCVGTAEMDAIVALDPSPDDAAELQALQDGARRLAEGCRQRSGRLLPHVSTGEAARDLDLLRASLGDPALTYLGYSYGTSIGAEYLRLFPDRVRAMVLDSPLDPALTWDQLLEGQAVGFDAALAGFLRWCDTTGCAFRRAVAGDLGAAFDALAARIDTSPLRTGRDRVLGPGELSLGVGAGLYSRTTGWPVLAEALARAARGDGSGLLALSDAYLDRTDQGYAGTSEANLAVNCIDRPWPRDAQPYLDVAERLQDRAPRFGAAIALAGLGCAAWPVDAVSVPAPVRAQGAPPVVVVGITRDPATPYAWAQSLAASLPSAVLLTLDGDGHTAYRAGARACLTGPVDAYLVDRRVPAPTTC